VAIILCSAPGARARIPQLRLLGGDALASAIHPFVPSIPLISGIDIALWDIAGKDSWR
jgi:L-alanine-DL-glutamate epimerase-like enolase superfamily enzyme